MLTQLLRSSVLIAALVGCERVEDECTTTQCFETALIDAADADDASITAALSLVPDQLSRVAVVASVITSNPEMAGRLCGHLPHSISKSRCESVAGRTHLWEPAEPVDGPAARAGSGPVRSAWVNEDWPEHSWPAESGVQRGCSSELDPTACAWGHALEGARSGDGAVAGQWCAGLKSRSRWRADCFFQSAETLAARWGRARVDEAFALCAAADQYRGICASELVTLLTSTAPVSTVSDVVRWAPQLMTLNAVRSLFDDPVDRFRLEDRYWALMMHASVSKASALSGDAFEALPAAAAVHVRAAVAYRLITERAEALSLDEAVGVVATVLERRTGGDFSMVAANRPQEVIDLWPHDREGESHLAAVSYLGHSRRTVANDPERDIAICVLEAAARAEPPWQTVLEEAKNHTDERVKWTAIRLVEQLEARRLGTTAAQWAPEPVEPTPDL